MKFAQSFTLIFEDKSWLSKVLVGGLFVLLCALLVGIPFPADLPYPRDTLPAGFIVSNAEDMSHYLIAQLNDGRYSRYSDNVLWKPRATTRDCPYKPLHMFI